MVLIAIGDIGLIIGEAIGAAIAAAEIGLIIGAAIGLIIGLIYGDAIEAIGPISEIYGWAIVGAAKEAAIGEIPKLKAIFLY